jgi:hypothetical protein
MEGVMLSNRSVFFACLLSCAIFLTSTFDFADSEISLKHEMELRALRYFIENAQPETGQVRDNSENFFPNTDTNNVASFASTGFGLSIITNASIRGMVTKKFATSYVTKTLKFALSNVPRRKGWFVHFYDWKSGARLYDSEYSTIDTALFLTGALYAREVLNDPEITRLSNQIYKDIDFWDAMTDGGARPTKRTLSMAFSDQRGYTDAQWNMYAEEMILIILGLGHPGHPLPREAWLAFSRESKRTEEIMGLNQALFVHQYSQLFLDFRNFNDGFRNYFQNSKALSQYHRDMANSKAEYKTLREGYWGMSAGIVPDGYGVANALSHGSTVCIGCAIASAPYFSKTVLDDAAKWVNGPYGDKIWGRYGITDSIDLDQNWFSQTVLGITVGPEFLALSNVDEKTSVWKDFMAIPEIKKGLSAARGISKQNYEVKGFLSSQNLTGSNEVVVPKMEE